MTQCEWILCERDGRWAAGLRVAMTRSPTASRFADRIFEVRSLDELAIRQADHPHAMALIEVRAANLDEVLIWLAEHAQSRSNACHVALLDDELASSDNGSAKIDGVLHEVSAVVLVAGATAIATSPRQLSHVLTLGRRHAALQMERPDRTDGRLSFAAWAWAQLPWQDA